MILLKTSSQWGNLYKHRYFIDGIRVAKGTFAAAFLKGRCTPENGKPMENTSYGFRKFWEVK